jgi:hypothetical protein
VTFATARRRQHRSLGFSQLVSTTRGHTRGFIGLSNSLSTIRVDELRGAHPLGAALQGERTSFDAPPCPLPASLSQTPRVISGPSWRAGNAHPSVLSVSPGDLGPASRHTPRRVHQGCEPGAFHHRPRAPAASIRSCVFFPIQRLRPGVATSRGSRCLCYRKRAAASTGTSPLFPLPARPIPLRGESLRLSLPRPAAAPRWLLRP